MPRKATMTTPDYLVIGAITKDIVPGGYSVGGTVTYGAITARRLGHTAAIVTSASSDLILPVDLNDVGFSCVKASNTTTFRNVYQNGSRIQYVDALAAHIGAGDVPNTWRQAETVHLGPLVQELDEELAQEFPGALTVATPQGWLRRWDAEGRVSLNVWTSAERLLPFVTAIVFSDEDMRGDRGLLERLVSCARTVVVTNGARGATVYHEGTREHLPARVAREVDPTGAGDVFAAAFLIRLHELHRNGGSLDPWRAAQFANVVASFSVEGPGFSAIPSRQQVEDYLRMTGLA